MEFIARVLKPGKITIKKEVRELLEIEEGDYVSVTIKKVEKEG